MVKEVAFSVRQGTRTVVSEVKCQEIRGQVLVNIVDAHGKTHQREVSVVQVFDYPLVKPMEK